MAVWTLDKIRRLSNRVHRMLEESTDGAVLIAPGQHTGAMKIKYYESLQKDIVLQEIPVCFMICAAGDNPKYKIDLLLFGRENTAKPLWSKVKAWSHEIIVEARKEIEAYKDDEDSAIIKSYNDGVITLIEKIRGLARTRIEQHFAVDLSPRKVVRS